MTKDAFAFLDTQEGRDCQRAGTPAHEYKYVHIEPRRGIGKTFATAHLANLYNATMIVFHSHDCMNRFIKKPQSLGICQTNPDYAFTASQIKHRDYLPIINHISNTCPSPLTHRFKLGIIEDAGAIWSTRGLCDLDEVRDIMFSNCDIVVEFG